MAERRQVKSLKRRAAHRKRKQVIVADLRAIASTTSKVQLCQWCKWRFKQIVCDASLHEARREHTLMAACGENCSAQTTASTVRFHRRDTRRNGHARSTHCQDCVCTASALASVITGVSTSHTSSDESKICWRASAKNDWAPSSAAPAPLAGCGVVSSARPPSDASGTTSSSMPRNELEVMAPSAGAEPTVTEVNADSIGSSTVGTQEGSSSGCAEAM